MATHLEPPQLVELTAATYDELRPTLRTGDLFFCSGNYLVSRLIRRFSKSPWSHVGVILRDPEVDRVLLLESVEDMGVRLAPLSKYVRDYGGGKPYDGQLVVARFGGKVDLRGVFRYGLDQLTRPYGKVEMLWIAMRILFNRGRREKSRTFVCSELVQACFHAGGFRFDGGPGGYISPEDVWKNPAVVEPKRIEGRAPAKP